MTDDRNRILTTHTGSLPRPPGLTQLYIRRARGEAVDPAELGQAGRAALDIAIERQLEAGIDIGNNGEQQRDSFFLHLRDRLTGLGGSWSRRSRADVDRYPEFKRMREEDLSRRRAVNAREGVPKAIGEVRYIGRHLARAECADFKAALARRGEPFVEAFVTAPSPGIVATAILNEHYPTDDDYLRALGEALQVEYEEIVRSGFVLQLDCPDLGLERHLTYQDRPVGDFLNFVGRVVATINTALRNIPRERVRMHVCWGNYEGPHDSDIELAEIFPILKTMKVAGFVLPFANPRHAHEYRCLKTFPLDAGQYVVAGVIDPLTNFIEHPEVVAERIERVAAAVGDPRRVLAGADCGFDSAAGVGRVAADVVWAKLKSLSAGARIASARLF